MSEKSTDPIAGLELLAQWEGEAEHSPGVLLEEAHGDGLLGVEVSIVELASWVAVTVITGVVGNAAYEAIRTKVLGVLTAWRRRKGQTWLDELKQQVFEQMQKHRSNGKLTEQDLRNRIDAFFAEAEG